MSHSTRDGSAVGHGIDPGDDELAAQLGAIKWAVTSAGQIKIESKQDSRSRPPRTPGAAPSTHLRAAVEEPADQAPRLQAAGESGKARGSLRAPGRLARA